MTGLNEVLKNIEIQFEKRKLATYALCKRYATLAIKNFRELQAEGYYWDNQSYFAMDLMFTKAFMDKADDSVGFFMSHGVNYGVYLELANNELYAAIKPTINDLLPDFEKDLKKLW